VGGIKEKKSASSIFSKDVEHDFPKEIKTEIKFAFVRNVGEALEEAFGKEGWKRWVVEGNEDRLGEDDVNGDDDEWDGSEGGDDQDVFERRGVVWVGSRL